MIVIHPKLAPVVSVFYSAESFIVDHFHLSYHLRTRVKVLLGFTPFSTFYCLLIRWQLDYADFIKQSIMVIDDDDDDE